MIHLIKINSEDKRKDGFFWIVLRYDNEFLIGTPEYIHAKKVDFKIPVTTAEHNGGFYIKAYGQLIGTDGNYEIH